MKVKSEREIFELTRCESLLSQLRGMIFKKLRNDGLIFIFKKEIYVSLHMIFVFRKIDIVYINEKLEIIKILKKVKPFTLHIKAVRCKYVLELKDCKSLKVKEKIIFF